MDPFEGRPMSRNETVFPRGTASFLLAPVLLVLSCAGPSAWRGGRPVPVEDLPPSGVKVLEGFTGKPDSRGILARFPLELPAFEAACFFSSDGRRWPGDANRIYPWMAKDLGSLLPGKGKRRRRRVEPHGLFLLLKLPSGEVLALLPLAGPETMSWLELRRGGRVDLLLGNLGTSPVSCDAPLLAWGRSGNPYEACALAWKRALLAPPVRGRVRFRSEKTYPVPFRYLGWCSWEQYKKRIDEKVLLSAARGIEASGIPVRWLLVDDGFQTMEDGMLVSFAPDKKKFPRGWAPLLAMRKPGKIRWMGLWNAFIGLWHNISPRNELGDLNRFLAPLGKGGSLLPKADPASARAFYDAFLGSMAGFGFDFAKIDVQSYLLREYRGTPRAVRAAALCSQALEEAARKHLKGLINCMAQNAVCLFNTRYSAVTRCSIDYSKGSAARGRRHIFQSFHNTLWLGQTVWPDHDMFHSSDPACGRLMAVSKALSGGPIYLSDAPDRFVKEFILPLCLSDGLLLRPLAPAAPLPDSIFLDPIRAGRPYRVVAPLPFGAAAVGVYDLAAGALGSSVVGRVTPSDYAWAGCLVQPLRGGPGAPWKVPEEGLVVWDWYARTGRKLDREYTFELKGFSDRLLILCPVREGWAAVGDPEKYLSPAALREAAFGPSSLVVTLREPGSVVIWSGGGRPSVAKGRLVDLGGGFYRAESTGSPVKTWMFRR